MTCTVFMGFSQINSQNRLQTTLNARQQIIKVEAGTVIRANLHLEVWNDKWRREPSTAGWLRHMILNTKSRLWAWENQASFVSENPDRQQKLLKVGQKKNWENFS